MQVQTVIQSTSKVTVMMRPVCGNKPFGPNGESEDNTFARYTPSGELSLDITNPELVGKIQPGQTFYVDFTLFEPGVAAFPPMAEQKA